MTVHIIGIFVLLLEVILCPDTICIILFSIRGHGKSMWDFKWRVLIEEQFPVTPQTEESGWNHCSIIYSSCHVSRSGQQHLMNLQFLWVKSIVLSFGSSWDEKLSLQKHWNQEALWRSLLLLTSWSPELKPFREPLSNLGWHLKIWLVLTELLQSFRFRVKIDSSIFEMMQWYTCTTVVRQTQLYYSIICTTVVSEAPGHGLGPYLISNVQTEQKDGVV